MTRVEVFSTMDLGYDRPLYLLAFDHRGSFQVDLMGVAADPSDDERAAIADAKALIYEGFRAALDGGVPAEEAGVLVDEEFGDDVARRAAREGITFAMPVERSGRPEFDFEYGTGYGAHLDRFDPPFAKVLVRYNPDGDAAMNARQAARLRELSEHLHERGRKYLFELLVPPTPAQLDQVGGEGARFDAEVRPGLVVRAIRELQEAGVEPDVWKIEGLDAREDCASVAAQARAGGRSLVACIVLGRGADEEAVARWLRVAAGVPGFVGFAIGRTMWWDALTAHRAGEIDRAAAVARIAGAYRRMIDVYRSAS